MQKAIKRWFPLFVVPTVVAFIISFIAPFLMGIYLSFTKFKTVTKAQWVGFSNYAKAFEDSAFIDALWFTVKFTIVSVITINVIAFLLALLLTKSLKGTNIFRTVFFMPNLIGGIVLGYIWLMIINGVLSYFDLSITYDASYGFWGLVILMNWQLIGYMMIIYIAGFQSVPADLYEAAKIDGATKGQMLTNVTLPMMMPSITICSFLTLTNSFKLFDQNLALTGGAPLVDGVWTTRMMALNIYKTFYGEGKNAKGTGQAEGVIFFLIVVVISLVQLWLTRRKEVQA